MLDLLPNAASGFFLVQSCQKNLQDSMVKLPADRQEQSLHICAKTKVLRLGFSNALDLQVVGVKEARRLCTIDSNLESLKRPLHGSYKTIA